MAHHYDIWDEIDEFYEIETKDEMIPFLVEFLQTYTQSATTVPDGYASDGATDIFSMIVSLREEMFDKLQTIPLEELQQIHSRLQENLSQIQEKGHFSLGDPIFENNDENGEITGYENGTITPQNLNLLEYVFVPQTIQLLAEVIDYKQKLPQIQQARANIALTVGTKLPKNITKQIMNYSVPQVRSADKQNFLERVNLIMNRKETAKQEQVKKTEEARQAIKKAFQEQQSIQAGIKPKRCAGLGCSIMGGKRSRKRKGKKSRHTRKRK